MQACASSRDSVPSTSCAAESFLWRDSGPVPSPSRRHRPRPPFGSKSMAMHMRNRTTLAQCISSARARADRLRVMPPWVAVYFGRSKPRPPRDVDKHQSPIIIGAQPHSLSTALSHAQRSLITLMLMLLRITWPISDPHAPDPRPISPRDEDMTHTFRL